MTNEKSTAMIHHAIARQRREKLAEEMNKAHISRLKNQKVNVSPQKIIIAKKTTIKNEQTHKEIDRKKLSYTTRPAITIAPDKSRHISTPTISSAPKHIPAPISSDMSKHMPALKSASQLKNEAISKALGLPEANEKDVSVSDLYKNTSKKSKNRTPFFTRRFAIALSCAFAAVFTLGYFVNLNLPNIPARVAAMQAGFNIKYPAYIPQGYSLTSITSDKDSKVTIHLSNGKQRMLIKEERSTWDSQALLHNFVKKTWGNSFATTRDQGLTIYFGGNNAAWVNGGILYRIEAGSDISRLQLHNIVYSL